MILLSKNEMALLAEFNKVTHATARDVIVDEPNERMIFIVKSGDMGLAIGHLGVNVKRLSKLFGDKRIEMVEEATTVEDMIAHALYPAKVQITKNDEERKIIYIQVVEADKKGFIIGQKGKTIEKCRVLCKRYFGTNNIIVM